MWACMDAMGIERGRPRGARRVAPTHTRHGSLAGPPSNLALTPRRPLCRSPLASPQPATVTVAAGDSVTWVNNAGFPHNVVFDEDAVPDGVNAEAISREDYLNAPGEKFSVKFSTPGTYGYYCEPHQGAGMVGKVRTPARWGRRAHGGVRGSGTSMHGACAAQRHSHLTDC